MVGIAPELPSHLDAMQTTDGTVPNRVLVLEPNPALRSAILTVLAAEHYDAEACQSLEQALACADGSADTLALVAWQSMEGLLAEEHRDHLVELTRRLRVVVMVPRTWARLLESTDVGKIVSGLVPKPFVAEELLSTLREALAQPVDA